ncbi:universal stress protein [Streptomyces parvus]|uniref:UspA domain-containing protein n=2 Tax=Streptomyces TaxID=1883 RepID=A0A1E7M0M2_9ACTN|nr:MULTISPECIES: universal stress protein [Streptomyces]OEV22015.1 hypothetical protein AN221_03525 [Streptomyces nanshensis]ONI49839.1 hypothetical protein STIB_61380 [Streptomyces sp. IB2014 011-1]RDV48381.1 universal stress protein [Streptomyces sp. IB2014 011-12]
MTTLSLDGQPPLPAPDTHPVYVHTVTGRPAGGRILAVLTGSRADRDVAAHAGQLAARTGTKLTAAVVFRSTGFSINALLHLTRARRLTAQADAVLAPRTEALTAAGHYKTVTALLPARTNPYHRLPARTLRRLAHRTGTDTVITSVPIHPPGSHFTTSPRPTTHTPSDSRRTHAGAPDP